MQEHSHHNIRDIRGGAANEVVILLFYRSFLVQYELIYDVHQQNSTFPISVPALINTLYYIYIHSTISVGNMGLMIRSFIFDI